MSDERAIVEVIDEQMKRDDLTDQQVLILVLARAYLGPQPQSRRRSRAAIDGAAAPAERGQ